MNLEPTLSREWTPARDADAMIVMVRDDAQVHEVVFGELGLLATAPTGSVLVLHSTVAPDTVRRVHAATVAAGVRFVDAGISTGGGRSIGEMYVMCGGEPEAVAAAMPVLEVDCRDIVRYGNAGAGMRAKLIRNAMRYALFGVLYEGMALAEAAGLDLAAMAHLYRSTFGTCADDEVVLARPTMRPVDPAASEADSAYVTYMTPMVTLGWKDLDDAFELADELGFDLSLARAARPLYGPALGIALAYDT